MEFLDKLNKSVMGKKRSEVGCKSPILQHLIDIIEYCKNSIDDYLPDSKTSRFGHVEFRNYYDHILLKTPLLLAEIISKEFHSLIPEITSYFCSSFGNRQRIDYGTGHELHFAVFLYSFDQIHMFREEEYSSLVLHVFWLYLDWMRKLQTTYWLEPAGSHGVWGLDDYHFLPFYFGSSQLVEHKYIRPKSIHNEDIVVEYSNEYLYLKSIDFINKIKTDSLVWHSPMLNDISGVKNWSKINEGMRKMYLGEVFGKLPIMQHLLFGKLFGNIDNEGKFANISNKLKTHINRSFNPSSGYTMPTFHVHQLGCEAADEQEPIVEVIVKHVTNSKGEKIPIFGKVPVSVASQKTPDGLPIYETYAYGQSHPTCCGIRIPSAISVHNSKEKQMPFD